MGLLLQARELRWDSTPAERQLWARLRKHQLGEFKFRRQMARLVVELDGVSHIESRGDTARNQWMTQQGLRVLRFSNLEVFSNLEGVLTAIADAVRNSGNSNNTPPPLAGGGRGEGEQPAPPVVIPPPAPNPLPQGEGENPSLSVPPTNSTRHV